MVPKVGIDYAFVGREEETERVTILVVKDRETRAIQASVMRHKGTCHDEAGERAAEFIKNLGHHGKLMFKADNESALKDLREATILHLDQGILPVKPPVGESQSNGMFESGLKTFKGMLRVHLMALERKLGGVTIPTSHPIMTWLTEYAADVLTKYLVGADEKSGYQRLVGKNSNEEEFAFGERVLYRPKPSKDMNVVLDARWRPGLWLGRNWGSSIHRVAIDAKHVVEARVVHRVVSDERWAIENITFLQATPWAWHLPDDVDEPLVVILVPGAPVPAAAPQERPYQPRRLYINHQDLQKHGHTSGCRRCMLMRTGRSVKGSNHSPPCRARIEERVREDGDPRVQEAVDRFAEAVAPQIEAAEALAQEESVPTPVALHKGPEAATSLARRPGLERSGYQAVPGEMRALRESRLAAELGAPAPAAAAPQDEGDADAMPPSVAEEEDDEDGNMTGPMMPKDDDSADDQDDFLQNLMKTMPRKFAGTAATSTRGLWSAVFREATLWLKSASCSHHHV